MTEDECLQRYGLTPSATAALTEIRGILRDESKKELDQQGKGDTELMKLCCVQLFSLGALEDSLLIWQAKESSFDAHSAIDVQLLCGAGLQETKRWLSTQRPEDRLSHQPRPKDALEYLESCEASGDFAEFSPSACIASWRAYYRVG